ncbi:pyocin knob domain-containing protein [Streptomyces griseoincarnatus]|uniref:pyocin knob domain-containing protein n=1 Tax=Paenibacillus glucanolyticus TaxID=59843 RepID=UPI0036C2CB17
MPEKSGFFDSTADDIRSYPARDFAEYFSRFVTNGVFNGGNNLEVIASGNDANVQLKAGYAWINGYVYSVYDNPITLAIEPASTMDRIDRVILRLDTSVPIRAIRAIVLQGAPNTTPTPPSLVRSGNIYDLSLAQIRVKANSTIIEQSNITDERLNEVVCGLVNSLIRVDTATFQRQWDEFIQSIQNTGFATTQYVDNKANVAETNAKNYANTGFIKKAIELPAGTDINNLTEGEYYCPANATVATFLNAPDNQACYIKVGKHAGVNQMWYVFSPLDNRVFMRNYYPQTGWGPWLRILNQNDYDALFQSVANGKQAIATAISDKGVAASGSDEFAVLANKISQINTGKRFVTGQFVINENGVGSVNNLAFRPRNIIFSNITQTASNRYAGAYSADAPADTGPLSQVFGIANGHNSPNAFTITSNGFSVSTSITVSRVYNFIAFE